MEGIHITSYMTLAYGNALKDETIIQTAQKHNATAQIILSWAIALVYSVIPSSMKRQNLHSNPGALTITLDADDIKAIAPGKPGRTGA